MREIKFRAFQDNQMYLSPISSNYGLQRFFGILYEDAPIMQFTGLLAKNGIEIFEGDILSEKIKVDGEIIDSAIPVLWDDETAMFVVDLSFAKNGTYTEPLYQNYEGLEIIGNIYQNPELLQCN